MSVHRFFNFLFCLQLSCFFLAVQQRASTIAHQQQQMLLCFFTFLLHFDTVENNVIRFFFLNRNFAFLDQQLKTIFFTSRATKVNWAQRTGKAIAAIASSIAFELCAERGSLVFGKLFSNNKEVHLRVARQYICR